MRQEGHDFDSKNDTSEAPTAMGVGMLRNQRRMSQKLEGGL